MVFLHIGHYAQNAAGSPLVLVGVMAAGAGLGLLLAFSREIRASWRKHRTRLDRGEDSP